MTLKRGGLVALKIVRLTAFSFFRIHAQLSFLIKFDSDFFFLNFINEDSGQMILPNKTEER